MPDSTAGSFAAINGSEFVNAQRTVSYIQHFGLPISVSQECWCPNIKDLLDCPASSKAVTGVVFNKANLCDADESTGSVDYGFPASDIAPWYDPAVPESADFLGFLPVEFEGLGSTFTRASFDVINGGSVLGRLRPQARTLTWRGFLFGASCCAAEYGLRWLTSTLAGQGGCDNCDGSVLDLLLCCPNVVECNDCDQSTGLGPAADAFRTFYRVGLVDGPRKLGTRNLGCCEGCASGCIIEVEFSLIAGNPWMYRDPVLVCGPDNFPSCGICPDDNDPNFWQKIPTTTYPASEEDMAACQNLLTCGGTPENCVHDPKCPQDELPKVPDFVDPCGCEPFNVTEICCEISNDVYGQFFEGVPQVEIFSGSQELHNVTLRVFENPQERHCDDADLFDKCNECDSVTIRYMPPQSTLFIDGITKRITIECKGGNEQPGESLSVSPLSWPVFKCISYILKVQADCNFPVADDATVSITVVPREM